MQIKTINTQQNSGNVLYVMKTSTTLQDRTPNLSLQKESNTKTEISELIAHNTFFA